MDLTDYKTDYNAWRQDKESIGVAQNQQKKQHDKRAKRHDIKAGDRVMVYMPSAVTGKMWKLARPYYGLYRIVSVTPTKINVEAKLIGEPCRCRDNIPYPEQL